MQGESTSDNSTIRQEKSTMELLQEHVAAKGLTNFTVTQGICNELDEIIFKQRQVQDLETVVEAIYNKVSSGFWRTLDIDKEILFRVLTRLGISPNNIDNHLH